MPTVVAVKKIKTSAPDLETFSATIHMLDYHTNQPITLNGIIHVKTKTSTQTGVYIAISPKPLSHTVWQQLNEIGNKFRLKVISINVFKLYCHL